MAILLNRVLLLVATLALSACALISDGAYTNEKLTPTAHDPHPPAAAPSQASFRLRSERRANGCDTVSKPPTNPKRQSQVLVLLALSGGGSRAAYFSALTMLEMERQKAEVNGIQTDLLHEVDAISTVSGGGLAGAFYAVSHDPGEACAGHSKKVWNAEAVEELMPRDYLRRWIMNWFNPVNAARFWFTYYDRTDIMAQTFANNLFGDDLSIAELNPLRPNLILNATSGTALDDGLIRFGEAFTFTDEDFRRICSDIEKYSVARGVMASATFPGAFNFMTLRDYHNTCMSEAQGMVEPPPRYLHVFDGGNSDNLGLTSLRRVIWEALEDRDGDHPHLAYRRVIVVLVDSFVQSPGADPTQPDPRSSTDFIVDSNFLDATDSLLQANRERLLDQFRRGDLFPFAPGGTKKIAQDYCTNFFHDLEVRECATDPARWAKINKDISDKLKFVHVQFSATPDVAEGCASPSCLLRQLNRITTSFKLSNDVDSRTGLTDREAIACAVPAIFGRAADTDARKACGKLRLETRTRLQDDWDEVRRILRNP
ncbi:MAG TPA: patatin-like phospholipase family protein [Aromatoleum sp.]|uniref:patatin-like phospholipase family protein n=1 Tax=Aromatoleum sp. TaxID=2307007 RepID=UPI002B46B154|nr:patatin-like phospholipase family protein [Aromatoleum sp.]HJV27384.1 patatin-like phospholipase family protein [Aromatoleum sp.]